MDVGIHYANFTHPEWQTLLAERLTATARIADEGGVSLFTGGHCEDLGRDYDAIRKTILWFGDPVAEPDRFVREMGEYAALGITLASVMPPTEDPVGWAGRLVELLPRVR